SRVFREGLPPLMNRVKQLPILGPRLRDVDLVGTAQRFLQELPRWVTRHKNVILGVAQTALTGIVLTVSTVATAIFMLLHGPALADSVSSLILDDFRRARARRLARNMLNAVSGYVNGNLLISLVASTVTAVALLVMRVPFVAVGYVLITDMIEERRNKALAPASSPISARIELARTGRLGEEGAGEKPPVELETG